MALELQTRECLSPFLYKRSSKWRFVARDFGFGAHLIALRFRRTNQSLATIQRIPKVILENKSMDATAQSSLATGKLNWLAWPTTQKGIFL